MTSYAVPRDSHDLYWWHGQILDDLSHGLAVNTHAIASNVGSPRMDVERWVQELVDQGYLVDAEPAFDYDARWVRRL